MAYSILRAMCASAFGVFVLAGCTQVEKPVVFACDTAKYSNLIGQNAAALDTIVAGKGEIRRIISPGMMVTMDYRMERVNFRLGVDGLIKEITCG
jgi:hypothetical protein